MAGRDKRPNASIDYLREKFYSIGPRSAKLLLMET